MYLFMDSVTALPPEKVNTWKYVLESRTTSGITSVEISVSVTTLKSYSYVMVSRLTDEHSVRLTEQIQEQLKASLGGDMSKPITPDALAEIMSQEWAKAYSPVYHYIPSFTISSLVRPYSNQDSLPSEVVKAIADELDTTEEIALDYGRKTQTAINHKLA